MVLEEHIQSDGDVERPVRLTGPSLPAPLVSPDVLTNLTNLWKSGLDVFSLSSYQNHIISIIQSKRDLMACSLTPTNRADYLIPIISEIKKNVQTTRNNNNDPSVSPHCLIITQAIRNIDHIKNVADRISGEGEGVRTLAINQRYLSEDLKEELRKSSNILVARPAAPESQAIN